MRLNSRGLAAVSRSKTGRGQVTAPIFLLVPQVKLPKRLDLARDAERAHEAVPGLIVANWVESDDGFRCNTASAGRQRGRGQTAARDARQTSGAAAKVRA